MNLLARRTETFNFLGLLSGIFLSFGLATSAIDVQIGLNFRGGAYGTESLALPADGNGTAGPGHFIEFINGRFSVYDKSTGVRVQNMTDRVFWTRAGVTFPSGTDITDPRIVFDVYSQRWFALQVDLPPSGTGNRFLVAASETSNPTGAWHGIGFTADPVTRDFADFPSFGVDENGVYLGADLFNSKGTAVGPTLVSIPKAGLLQIPPNISQRTSFGVMAYTSRGFVMQPAVTIGRASTEETVFGMGNLGLDSFTHKNVIFSTVQGASAANATLSAPTILTITPFVGPTEPTQPDGSQNLDAGDARISAFVRRVGDVVYGVHSVKVSTRDAIQWFKIDAVNKTVLQTGMITDTDLNFIYPSIAANEDGTVVIGCNGTSPTVFVSSYAFVGETVNGTLGFGAPMLLKSGAASVQNVDSTGVSRWGDYSATSLDPADPNRFWTIQMYALSTTSWATQITELITSKPGAQAPPAIVTQPSNLTVIEGHNATLTVAVSGSTPLSYQWLFNGASLLDATNSILILTNVEMAKAGSYAAIISNAVGTVTSDAATLTVQPVLRLSSPIFGSGNFSFQATGPTNASYIISFSTNLTDWLPVMTNTVDNGTMNFTMPVDFNSSASFYRVTVGP